MAVSYEDWLLAQGLTAKTVAIYAGKLHRAEELATEQGWDLQQLTATQAGELAGHFPWSASTRRQLRTALTHYWRMHDCSGPVQAIRVPRKPRGHYRGLEPDEARLLAKTSAGWWPQGTATLCGLYLGLRRLEIAQLRWDSFDRDLEWATILGKHDRTRVLPVHQRLRDELRPHLSAYVRVFPGRNREYVHPATIWSWVEEVSETAGVRITRPHQLRHTFGATINDGTRDLRTTQEMMGHSRPETTAIYTRTTQQRMLDAADSLDYLD